MRIIHTSDWHLGHELHGFDRGFEHDAFLGWLLGQLVELKADALIVTGDIYDAVNPPVAAQQRLYRFVKRVLEYIPHFQIVIIGGNHDSAGRLELPKHLLDANRVHLVGGMPREGGRPAVAQTLIKLHDQHAVPRIVCGAVPYIRPGDLPSTSGDNPLAALYREVVETANASAPDLPVIVTGHLYIDGGTASELSERRIVVGGEEMIPAAIFPPSIAYTALGHLHKPQSIPGLPMMRYAGSPIPMSVTERDYEHSIVVVDFRPERAIQTELRPIPRSVAFLRVPHTGAKSLDIIEDELRGLTIADPGEAQRPF
jgi:exonuclease SbcD